MRGNRKDYCIFIATINDNIMNFMSDKIKLSETVMLVDAAFLDFVVTDMKRYFTSVLKRELRDADLSQLMTFLALDAGIGEGKNDIQVLLVYDGRLSRFAHCHPSDLKTELNGVAFTNELGEFSFASVSAEEMVSREELYLDLLGIVSDSADVKKLILIPDNEEYGRRVAEALREVKDKEIIQFRMSEPGGTIDYRWELLAYPVMQALGIRGEEL